MLTVAQQTALENLKSEGRLTGVTSQYLILYSAFGIVVHYGDGIKRLWVSSNELKAGLSFATTGHRDEQGTKWMKGVDCGLIDRRRLIVC